MQARGWQSRKLAVVASILLALLVLVAFLRRPKEAPALPVAGQDEPAQTAGPSSPAMHRTEPSPPQQQAAQPAVDDTNPPPVIDSITLEKTSVCQGEENLVTVKAHTVNQTDQLLHYVIDGQMGEALPIRRWKSDHGHEAHFVQVFGRDSVVTTVPVPEYEVRDCRTPRMMNVVTRLRSNSWADFDIQANVVNSIDWNVDPRQRKSTPYQGVQYTWSFGDGKSETTTTPITEHNYERRPQDTAYSYFLIAVEARSKDGEVVKGRASLGLMNPAFEALQQKGIVVLLISLEPRFPELGPDGKVTEHVHIWHTRPQPVVIEGVAMTKYLQAAGGETRPALVDVTGILGTDTIPSGPDGITATLVFDPSAEPDVFSKTYRLSGKSAEGYPVNGSFSIMRPPPAPTRDNNVPVRDPVLEAKILQAREILGKNVVSDEDIWMLEREGKFHDLPPAATASPTDTIPEPTGVHPGSHPMPAAPPPQPAMPAPTNPTPTPPPTATPTGTDTAPAPTSTKPSP